MGLSRQEYWSGLPCPPPGNLSNPGIELVSLMSPALAGGFFTTSTTWVVQFYFSVNRQSQWDTEPWIKKKKKVLDHPKQPSCQLEMRQSQKGIMEKSWPTSIHVPPAPWSSHLPFHEITWMQLQGVDARVSWWWREGRCPVCFHQLGNSYMTLCAYLESKGDWQLLVFQNKDLALPPKYAITRAPPFWFDSIISSQIRKMRSPVMAMSMTRRNAARHPHE